ncbi:MAG: repressor LexA, partial [Actinomycetota bacterium]|nr:repressor LexA [Actinomycetota bacterium]
MTRSGEGESTGSTGPGRGASVSEIPDGPPDETGLTPRQRKVLEVIRSAVERKGYPPSMREIGEAVGLTSSSSVSHQLATLEKKGFLRRDPNRPRAIEVRVPEAPTT